MTDQATLVAAHPNATKGSKDSNKKDSPPKKEGSLKLDMAALERAKSQLDEGPVTPSYGPWRDDIIALLNDSLATELVCVLRYKRHYFTARGISAPGAADQFLEHAGQEEEHANRLAERIVQLGGMPDFSPDSLAGRSHADYDGLTDLKAMLRADLTAERIAIEAYRQMVVLIGDKDPTTRRLIEEILEQEEEHAEDLADLLWE